MNKLQKMALEDYLLENNDMNLKLFIQTLNPMFILKATTKKEIVALLDKYAKDKSKLRLAAIESYLGATRAEKKTIAKAVAIPVIDNVDPVISEKQQQLDDFRREYVRNLKANSPSTVGRQAELLDLMRALDNELGLVVGGSDMDIYNQGVEGEKSSKELLFKSIFGDWNIAGTAAWSLVNEGGMDRFIIQSAPFAGLWFNPDNKYLFDQIVMDITGRKKQPYAIVEDKTTQPSRWIFSKSAVSINNVIRDSDGRVYGAEAINGMRNADFVPR
jgi:hypothetical protein